MTIFLKHALSSFQVTDFVIILNTRSAVDAFSKGGNLTLGGNFTIAVGPLGRNAEGRCIGEKSCCNLYVLQNQGAVCRDIH